MPLPRNKRTDNPLTDHDDEVERPDPTRGEDIERVETQETDRPDEKILPVDPPDDDDAGPSGPTPRQQKRRARFDQMQADKDAAEARAREAEQLVAAMRAQSLTQPQPGAKPASDPLDEEEKTIRSDWQKHLELSDAYAKGHTPEQAKQWKDDFFAIQQRMQNLSAKRALAAAGVVPGQRTNVQDEVTRAVITATFPEMVGNPRALRYADGLISQKLAREGRTAVTLADYNDALNQTRRDLRMPGATSAPPTEETKRKFSGNGLNGGSASVNGGERQIRMTADDMKIAEAMYKQERDPKTGKMRRLKPAEAHAKWAQRVGKRVLAAKSS